MDSRRSGPGDFDAVLASLDRSCVERHEGDPDTTLRALLSADGEHVGLLKGFAEPSGAPPHDAVAKLLRVADRP